MTLAKGSDSRQTLGSGIAFAVAAYGFWGFNPIYFKAVAEVPTLEVVAHRTLWTVLLLALLLTLSRRWPAVAEAIKDRRTLLLLGFSTLVISANWLIYIWAIYVERVLETSLGYYINPLVSVLLGVVVLGERLAPLQALAVALAVVGVLNLAIGAGGLPWVAISLALTFGLYGLIRKTARVGAAEGLLVETSLILPFALGYLIYLAAVGAGSFAVVDLETDLLLIASGPVTMLPLVWFAAAARRLPLSLVGFFQYIAPTGHFLLAVFVFGEPFTRTHLITFLLIWTAVALFVWETLRAARSAERA